MTAPQQPPPPGWHPDNGGWRWWDGHQWGEWRPASGPPGPAATGQPNTGLALLSHIGGIFAGFLVPLIVFLTADQRDAFLRRHAAEALNFQITIAIVSISAVFLAIPITIFTLGLGLLLLIPLMIVASIAALVFMVQGAIAANRGEEYEYPVNMRMVKP